MNAHFWRTREAIIDWHRTAEPGSRLLYFVGDLLEARSARAEGGPLAKQIETINETANLVMGLFEEGVVDLRQARLDEGIRAYFCYKVIKDGVRLNEVPQAVKA